MTIWSIKYMFCVVCQVQQFSTNKANIKATQGTFPV